MKNKSSHHFYPASLLMAFCLVAAQFPGCAYYSNLQAIKEPPEKAVILNVNADKTTVYPDEALILKYEVLSRWDVSYEGFNREGNYKGFWLERFPMHAKDAFRTDVTEFEGRKYVRATAFKMFLFPMNSGDLRIYPGEVKIFVKNPGLEIDRKMFRSGPPIEINVKEFPIQGRPSSFTDSSGSYELRSDLSSKKPDANGFIYLEIMITGQGNLRQIKLPTPDFGPDVSVAYVNENVDLDWVQDSVHGKKTFKFRLHPNKTGLIKIPSVSFSYFDLSTQSYQTLTSQEYEVQIDTVKTLAALPNKKTTDENLMTILLDASGSMLAEDFEPKNRMTAAKTELKDFLNLKYKGLIQLKTFADEPSTVFSFSTEPQKMKDSLELVKASDKKEGGTAIGIAIYETALEMKDLSRKGKKMILLLSDGANNAGYIEPQDAALIAKDNQIVIYAIAIGTGGVVAFPTDPSAKYKRVVDAEVIVDEKSLNVITSLTGGKTFRAKTREELKMALREISSLMPN